MAVFRVERNKGYTVMSNHHLRNRGLTLKAKGLLSQMIQMALQELLQDKTVIMIAHKLSTIKNVDQILVLENGKITQRGTHDQLVSQDGLYQKLWNIQHEASSWSI